MKKFIHIVSMAALGVVLLNGFVCVDAASRTVSLNMSNQSSTTSSSMLASNCYPINFMIVAGDTSRGDIKYVISGVDQNGSYVTISYSGTCPVGTTHASTGFSGGTLAPLTINVDSFVNLTISKGAIRNVDSDYYIASGLISTPTMDVLERGISETSINGTAGQIDLDVCYAEMNRLAVEMRERVNEWDKENAAFMD